MDELGSRKPTASRQMIQLKRQALALAARFSGPPPDRADLYGDQPWEGLDLETRQRGRLARYGRPYRDTGFVNAACESTKCETRHRAITWCRRYPLPSQVWS